MDELVPLDVAIEEGTKFIQLALAEDALCCESAYVKGVVSVGDPGFLADGFIEQLELLKLHGGAVH